jgi:hypothetical protein
MVTSPVGSSVPNPLELLQEQTLAARQNLADQTLVARQTLADQTLQARQTVADQTLAARQILADQTLAMLQTGSNGGSGASGDGGSVQDSVTLSEEALQFMSSGIQGFDPLALSRLMTGIGGSLGQILDDLGVEPGDAHELVQKSLEPILRAIEAKYADQQPDSDEDANPVSGSGDGVLVSTAPQQGQPDSEGVPALRTIVQVLSEALVYFGFEPQEAYNLIDESLEPAVAEIRIRIGDRDPQESADQESDEVDPENDGQQTTELA